MFGLQSWGSITPPTATLIAPLSPATAVGTCAPEAFVFEPPQHATVLVAPLPMTAQLSLPPAPTAVAPNTGTAVGPTTSAPFDR